MDKPITPREIRKVYAGRIFTVQIESITLPKGGNLEAEVIRHPGSVVIVPVTDAGDIILVRQYRHAIGRWAWELPAGSLKPGEDVKQAAIRECHEEIGLIPSRVEPLGAFFPTPGYCDEEMFFFRASSLAETDEKAAVDEDEDIEVQVFDVREARDMVRRGEISDMKTVVALTLV